MYFMKFQGIYFKILERICEIQGVLMGFLEVWEPC